MLFPTVEFACFLFVVLAAAWASRPWPLAHKLVLVVASYIFYGWWDWRFMFLLFECSMVNWVLALAMDAARQPGAGTFGPPAPWRIKLLLGLGIVFNLAVLGFFKYWGFFLSSLNDVLHALGWQRDLKIIEVILPVGISFYTFQGISYLVDLYRGDIKAVRNPVDMLLFKAFFPQLVAGPIVRASEFLPQLEPAPARDVGLRATRAFMLIGVGLIKKVIIAHYLAVDLVNPAFEAPRAGGALDLLFGVYGYALQIYCDFSAYSDIAIGVALLFGYEFPRNFNQPYRATSLRDFWHRWHMSLSTFLRDYLYIPLGGSRRGELRTYANQFITFVLGGLWHGAAWNFVIWGMLHGGGLAAERAIDRIWGAGIKKRSSAPPSPWRIWATTVLKTTLVFHFVCLTWVFFNAESWSAAIDYLAALKIAVQGGGPANHLLTPWLLLLLGIGALGQFLPPTLPERGEQRLAWLPLPMQAVALAGVVVMITAFGPGALAPFIYFKF